MSKHLAEPLDVPEITLSDALSPAGNAWMREVLQAASRNEDRRRMRVDAGRHCAEVSHVDD